MLILDKENPLETKVQTAKGHYPARIVCVNRKGAYPIVYLIEYERSGVEEVKTCAIDGSVGDGEQVLINAPRSGEFWINVSADVACVTGALFYRRNDADMNATVNRLACIRVPWTEGDGL